MRAANPKLEALWAEMKKSGLKQTEPRRRVIQALFDDHGPFTAEEIHRRVTKKVCDLATIYRTLGSLEEAGILRRCEFGDGSARYELSGEEEHHHHHIVCRGCKRVEVVDDPAIEALFEKLVRKHGFRDASHHLEFFGTCPRCA